MNNLIIAHLYQSKYASLANGLTSQYSMKNNQYNKELISAAKIMKNHWHGDSGMIKTDHKTPKHEISRGENKIG